MKFVSEAITPDSASFDPSALVHGVPGLPTGFMWRGRHLKVGSVVRTWRSSKADRGDTYLDRLWFECALTDGSRAVVYFDKHAKKRSERWRLYTLADGDSPAPS